MLVRTGKFYDNCKRVGRESSRGGVGCREICGDCDGFTKRSREGWLRMWKGESFFFSMACIDFDLMWNDDTWMLMILMRGVGIWVWCSDSGWPWCWKVVVNKKLKMVTGFLQRGYSRDEGREVWVIIVEGFKLLHWWFDIMCCWVNGSDRVVWLGYRMN